MECYQEPGSTFFSKGRAYNLNPLFKIAQTKPTETIEIESLTWQLNKSPDPERVERADLSFPILVTPDPEGFLLIVDGDHRVRKAIGLGHRHIKAKRLTPEEMETAFIGVLSIEISPEEFQKFKEYYDRAIAGQVSPIVTRQDQSVHKLVSAASLMLIARTNISSEWKLVSNPEFSNPIASEQLAAQILQEQFVDYVEYSNCGVVYRVIRSNDLHQYLPNQPPGIQ